MASHTHMVIPGLYRHELMTQAGPIATLINREGAFVLLSGGALPLPEAEAAALRATANRNLMVLLRTPRPEGNAASPASAPRACPTARSRWSSSTWPGQKTVLGIDPQDGARPPGHLHDADGGRRGQVVATFSDYRPLSNGVRYPFKSEGTVDGKPVFTSSLEKVVVNGAIAESLFALPRAARRRRTSRCRGRALHPSGLRRESAAEAARGQPAAQQRAQREPRRRRGAGPPARAACSSSAGATRSASVIGGLNTIRW